MGVPEGVPEGRCGFVLEAVDVSTAEPGDVGDAEEFWSEWRLACCYRPSWNESDRCIWHADRSEKPVEELSAARDDVAERLDGAILEGGEVGDALSLAGCRLLGTRLAGAHLAGADLSGAVLRWADLRQADLSAAHLHQADLADATLIRANLAGAHLRYAVLAGADLRWADLTGAHLRQTNLAGAHLRRADLSRAHLDRADLVGAHLRQADLSRAYLRWADLTGTHLDRADLADIRLEGADLTGADFHEPDLSGAHLDEANLTGVDLFRADLSGVDIRGPDLSGAHLDEADLTNAELHEPDLSGAHLRRAVLADAHIPQANLSDADIGESDLSGVSLSEADLSNADLRGAETTNGDFRSTILHRTNLEGVELDGVDLRDADLGEAKLHNAHFRNVRIDDDTTFGDERRQYRSAYELDADSVARVGPSIEDDETENDTDGTSDGDAPATFLATKLDSIRCAMERIATVLVRNPIEAGRHWHFWASMDSESNEGAIENLEKAIWSYRSYQLLLRERALPDKAPRYYEREKHTRRKLALANDNWSKWLNLSLQRWTMLYGESPWRVVYTSLAVIVLSAFLYLPFGGIHVGNEPPTHVLDLGIELPGFLQPIIDFGEPFLASLYFSVVTFTTLGYGDIQPASGAAQLLAGVESLLGAALIALLVAVLSRRVMR